MPKYLFQANYVGKGIEGLMKEGGSRRREAGKQVIESVGGRLESFYYVFGDVDAVGVIEVPDAASAAAASMMINASGAVTIKLTPLMSPEEIDEASKKQPSYRPPGQ